MKIFVIRDENDPTHKDLAYLFYYENDKRFYIELPDSADPGETPLLLSTFAKRGETGINSYWSGLWVQQRIVPPDRQNIGQILRDNRLKEYDEFALLTLTMGRCAQDDYYLVPVDEGDLPTALLRRLNCRIEDVAARSGFQLLVFFRDGTVRSCDLKDYLNEHREFEILLKKPELFSAVQIQTDGRGLMWDEHLTVADRTLYQMGEPVPLSIQDFRSYAANRVVNAAEAAELLNCSRQYISELVRTGKLHPIKSSEKNTLFLKSEVLQRTWG